MIAGIYQGIRKIFTKKEEKGEFSSGYIPSLVREHVVKSRLANEGRVIEIGCGEGLLSQKLTPQKYIGIDFRHEVLKQAKSRALSKKNFFVASSADRLPFKENSFDAVLFINIALNLNSIRELEDALKESSRILRSGGSFIFDIRNGLNPLIFLAFTFQKYIDPDIKFPLRYDFLPAMKKLLEKHGFTVKNTVAIGFPLKTIAPAVLIEAELEKK